MDWNAIFKELGGGLSSVVIAALAFWGWNKEKRVSELTDRFIDLNSDNIQAMNRLSTSIREGKRGDE